jgi:hypothetical protein
MSTASNIVLTDSGYEPYGVGIDVNTFIPRVRLDNGVKYVGENSFAGEDEDVAAHAETLTVLHNLGNAAAASDKIRFILKAPVVRAIDGVDTTVGNNVVEVNSNMLRLSTTAEKERMAESVRILTGMDIFLVTVENSDPPF